MRRVSLMPNCLTGSRQLPDWCELGDGRMRGGGGGVKHLHRAEELSMCDDSTTNRANG